MTFERTASGRSRAGWVLLAILLTGLALRVYQLASNPPELIVDELDLYNSLHSYLTTGHDVDGSRSPFLWSEFTRNPPLYAVAEFVTSIPFGNGPVGLRLPAVIFGLIDVVLMGAIAFELTRRRGVGLIAAALTATQPIFVHFSRIAWEPAAELPFLLGGTWLWLRAFRQRDADGDPAAPLRAGNLAGGAVLLGLTPYTYMAGWFYAAALGGAIVVLNARRLRTRRDRIATGLAVLGAIVVAGPALAVWFGDPETYARTGRIATFHTGITLTTLAAFGTNYLAHFRWSYLVTTGDPVPGATWRYLAGFGAFFWWVIPLAAIGAVAGLAIVRARWAYAWMLWWLIVYPFGGALTNDGGIPSATRTLAGAPVFCLLAAIGAGVLLAGIRSIAAPRRRRFATIAMTGLATALLGVSLVHFAAFYFTAYARQFPGAWDSGTRATFAVIRDRAPAYQRVCFRVRPAWYGAATYARYYLSDTALTFTTNIDDPACMLAGTLLVTDQPLPRPGFVPLADVRELRGGPFASIAGRPAADQRQTSAIGATDAARPVGASP